MYEIDRRYYYKYNEVLGVNAQAVIRKSDEAWSSFFELLKLKKREGYHLTLERFLHQGIGNIGLLVGRRYTYSLETIGTAWSPWMRMAVTLS